MKRELEAKLCWSRHPPATLYLETLKRSQATYCTLTLNYTDLRAVGKCFLCDLVILELNNDHDKPLLRRNKCLLLC